MDQLLKIYNTNMATMCKHLHLSSFAINAVVCGYHIYKDIWTSVHGELQCHRKNGTCMIYTLFFCYAMGKYSLDICMFRGKFLLSAIINYSTWWKCLLWINFCMVCTMPHTITFFAISTFFLSARSWYFPPTSHATISTQ